MLLGELPQRAADADPDRTAIFFEDREISAREVVVNVGRVANGLKSLGVGKGDRVAIMLPNIPEFVYSFFAIQRIGAVAVPFNTMYKGGEVAHILADAGAKAVFALSNFAPLINEILPDLPDLEHVILTGERNVIFADPEATVFVQFVVARDRFADPEEAYRKVGEVLLAALGKLGVEGAWYKHRGSVRVEAKKMAGFVVQEAEELYVISVLIFVCPFCIEEFISVIWVPQEIKDKVLEPILSVAEAAGRKPTWEELRSAVSGSFESTFGIRLAEAGFERDELFGYEKLRTQLGR